MNQTVRIIAGVLFLLLSVTAITVIRINPNTSTPTRSTQTRTAGITQGILPGKIHTQEFTAIKDYMSGIELIFTHGGRNNTNENTLLLLDSNYKTLYTHKFSSAIVKEGDMTPFLFDKSIYVGKGNLLRLCLFSNDASPDNMISALFNQSDSIGPFYLSQVINNDLAGSLKNRIGTYNGSIIIRTYGSDSGQFWLMKVALYFLATIFACFIIWFNQIRTRLVRIRIIPEWVFLIIALPVSAAFVFITPPLQVPDETNHLFRAYEIAEFNILKHAGTSPASMLELDSVFARLHSAAGEKTSLAEINAHSNQKLEPGRRVASSPPELTLPYLPQALGAFIGIMFDCSPMTLMYLGRLFNMLISILIIFFAIRIIPQFKWIFLLLALMPKTLFLFGSLSYDSLTISLSFLTIAVFFYYAFSCTRNIRLKDLALMGFLILLLLLCKPPYFMLGLLFFFIPRAKFGYLYKYIMISIGAVALVLFIYKGGPVITSYFSGKDSAQQVTTIESGSSAADLPLFRPDEQIKLILSDIPAYLKLIAKSGFVYYRSYILESFVGLLGYIDVELPDMLTYSYLILIILVALVLSGENVKLGIPQKTLLFLLLVATFVIVETAMFIYATRPGRDRVFGVQGRYFIPMAPLFFMLFYNRYLNPILNLLFSMRRAEYNKAKVKVKPEIYQEIQENERLFDKYLYLSLIFFCTFTLLYSIYITLIRYYNI
ncbi:MAG: DUF2142 domain-containing protein [Bacteroidetes bacterium]|nr:DUF2142 domain-containing protein [Bacteroidota bacterium]